MNYKMHLIMSLVVRMKVQTIYRNFIIKKVYFLTFRKGKC
jgi:hypothetical protein